MMIGMIVYHLFQGFYGTMLGPTNKSKKYVLNLGNASMAF